MEVFRSEVDFENELLPWFIYRYIKFNERLLNNQAIFDLYSQLEMQYLKKYTEECGDESVAKAKIEFLLQFESERRIRVTEDVVLNYIKKTKKDT